jgi:hypothetical protein
LFCLLLSFLVLVNKNLGCHFQKLWYIYVYKAF